MHKKLKRRLFLTLMMLSFTAITLVSTTLAWFSSNRETQLDDFNVDLEGYDGIQISIDGENFYSKLRASDVKKAISAKIAGIDVLADSKLEAPTLTDSFVNAKYDSISLKPIALNSLDWYKLENANTSFKVLDQESITDGYFGLKDAEQSDYVSFNVWFRIANTGLANKNYELCFTTAEDTAANSYIKATAIKSTSYKTTVNTAFECNGVKYSSGHEFEINPVSSMRLGAVINDGESYSLVEPMLGTASVPVKDSLEDRYNPANNFMYQYFNAYAPADLKPIEDANVIKYNTEDMNDDFNSPLARFTANEDQTKYLDIKVSFAIWQEAYDSDYIPGSQAALDDITIALGFKMREVLANEEI